MRLVSLATRAQALGFNVLQQRALEQLNAALNVLTARILTRFGQARGTADEERARQQARGELENVLAFVTTAGSAVLAVNPGLPTLIQQAIDSLNADMTVTVLFADVQAHDSDSGYKNTLPPIRRNERRRRVEPSGQAQRAMPEHEDHPRG